MKITNQLTDKNRKNLLNILMFPLCQFKRMAGLLILVTAFNVAQLQAQGSGSVQQSPLRGPEIINTENFTMTLGSRLQVRYNYLDRINDSSVSNFSIRRARFSLGGRAYEHFGYAMQLELAGSSVKILDANVRYQLAPFATFWAGQGKAFFGRQQLNSSGNLNFVVRTLVDGRF
jgi:phosphate-selective porin